jgi:hypothetical protein
VEEENPFYNIVTKEVNGDDETTAEQITETVNYFTLSLDTRIYLLYLLCEVNIFINVCLIDLTNIDLFVVAIG